MTRLKIARNLPRIQMLYWLKTDQVSTRKELVKLTGNHEATIMLMASIISTAKSERGIA